MKIRSLLLFAVAVFTCGMPAGAQQPSVQDLTKQIENLRKRIDELEKLKEELPKMKEATAKVEKDMKANDKKYVEARTKNKIRIDGRAFLGFLDAEKDGTNSGKGTFALPDGRLRFTYSPSSDIDVITRLRIAQDGMLNTPDKGGQLIDNFYLDLKNRIKGTDATLRLGRFKPEVGEETFNDNPVDSILINNSIPIVAGYDEGLAIFGTTKSSLPVRYALGLINDSSGVGSSKGLGKFMKLSGNLDPKKKWYLSGSFYTTSEIPSTTTTEMKVGGISSAPKNAVRWSRDLWELDATYNYQGGAPPFGGFGKPGAFGARVSYGQFSDDAIGGGADRDGDYWHIEALCNLTTNAYLAARYSSVGLDGNLTDKIGGVSNVNEYKRLQVGLGYRLTPLTVAKIEYMKDDEKPKDKDNDTLTLGVASRF